MNQEISPDIKEFLERPNTRYFMAAAKSFIQLLEIKEIEKDIFFPQAHKLLIELYTAGHNLETVDLKYSSEAEFDDDLIFKDLDAGVISALGQGALYLEIFDPAYTESADDESGWKTSQSKASQGWLVDDFKDIYRDLKIGLAKIEQIATDEAIEDGLWNLRFSFLNHWGIHCINALRYLHHLHYDGKRTVN